MKSWQITATIVLSLLAATSCRKQRPALVPPPTSTATPTPVKVDTMPAADRQWDSTVASASRAASRGDMLGADSTLREFASTRGGCAAGEADYFRALLFLTPTAPASKIAEALPLMDRYIGSQCLNPTRSAEASFIRRLAADVLLKSVSDSVSAEELKKIRDQLETTKKELDRLKMRVIPP